MTGSPVFYISIQTLDYCSRLQGIAEDSEVEMGTRHVPMQTCIYKSHLKVTNAISFLKLLKAAGINSPYYSMDIL